MDWAGQIGEQMRKAFLAVVSSLTVGGLRGSVLQSSFRSLAPSKSTAVIAARDAHGCVPDRCQLGLELEDALDWIAHCGCP